MSKSYFSVYADKFKIMRSELSDQEVLDMISALSDLCLWGETEYIPQTAKQRYFWQSLNTKFKDDEAVYKARSEAGKSGMLKRWEKQEDNKTDNKSYNKTDNKIDNKSDNQITNNKQQITNNNHVCIKTQSDDCVTRKKLVPDDWLPNEKTIMKLNEKGLDAKKTVERFINSCRAKNLKYIDFDRAILAWDWSKDSYVKKEKCWF